MSDQEKKTNEESLKTEKKSTTLKKQGARLPLGIPDAGGNYIKDIALKPWRMKEEKKIGALRAEQDALGMGQFVTSILATLCERLGPHDIGSMKYTERLVIISQMYMCDVFYAYMWLRVQNLGGELGLTMSCPYCKNFKYPYDADLESTEVKIADTIEPAMWDYALRTPMVIRGEEVKGFRMGPPRWTTMENIGETGLDMGLAKSGMIAGGIHGILGQDGPAMVSEAELEDMVKFDIESLTMGLEDNDLGPDMSVESKCPRCKRKHIQPLSWGYESFFGVSSQSSR